MIFFELNINFYSWNLYLKEKFLMMLRKFVYESKQTDEQC